MSAKRAKIREEKRKRKQRQMMWITGGAAAVVLVVIALALLGLNSYNQSYIMTFEGKKISINDFKFCAIFATSEETVKEESLQQLITFLTVDKIARENGLELTDEEKEEILSYSVGLKSYYMQYGMDLSFISDQRMAELIGYSDLMIQLQDKFTEGYVVDESDYSRRLADYTYNERVEYTDMQVRAIISYEEDAIENARLDLEMDVDFDEVLRRYSGDLYGLEEDDDVPVNLLRNYGLSKEDAESVLEMEPGTVTGVFETDFGMYVIMRVESVEEPTEEHIDEMFRVIYVAEKKDAMFDEILRGWVEEAKRFITVNERAYDAA